MDSSHARPVLIAPSSPAVLLDRVPLSGPGSESYTEAWLQDLLYQHPEALPISEIDDSFLGMIPICRELGTPAGPIDVLYVTPTGRIVVLEAKLWRNPEARRKVVGQILDYAKELSRWSYESLDGAVRAALRRDDGAPRSLLDLIRTKHPDIDESRFIDAISRNLRRGELLLLIAGDGIRENVGAITNFIEDHGTLQFTFGLIEMAIYRTPNSSLLVHPRVLAQSTIVRRIVVEMNNEQLGEVEADEEPADVGPRPDLEEQRGRFQSFWTEFLSKYRLDDQSQPLRSPARSTNQFYDLPKETNGWFCAVAAPGGGKAGVYFTMKRGPIPDRIFTTLSAGQPDIDSEIGHAVQWRTTDKWHSVAIWKDFGPALLTDRRTETQAWLGDVLNRFVNAFRPRVLSVLNDQ